MAACSDSEEFSVSRADMLAFSTDTLSLDTMFSNVPSATKSAWAYNRTGKTLRCTSVRMAGGNQSGFRANVDGAYLGPDNGYSAPNVDIAPGDSIRIYAEATTPANLAPHPVEHTDEIVFTLSNGNVQSIRLSAWGWDAMALRDKRVAGDETIGADTPIVVYGGIMVDSAATLTIAPGTTLYFHAGAGIDVAGTLLCKGEPGREVVLRGDRLDKMFDYLPYDNVSGQWEGVRLRGSSYGNVMEHTDLHGAFNGIVADSSDTSRPKLSMRACTVHNCQGYGIAAHNSRTEMENCVVSNSQSGCLAVFGGSLEANACTMAQFYPFAGAVGPALRFNSNPHPLLSLRIGNSIVTGYSDDEITGEKPDGDTPFNYSFSHCILRTPEVETEDSINFREVEYEDPADTAKYGRKHFRQVDLDLQRYDFRLAAGSAAIGKADPATAPADDRGGGGRDTQPDLGAYEWREEQ